MTTIYNKLTEIVNGEMILKASSSLSEEHYHFRKAVPLSISSFLGFILAKSDDPEIEKMIEYAGNAYNVIISNKNNIFSGNSNRETRKFAKEFADSIFDKKIGQVTSKISAESGISGGSAHHLLLMLSPLVAATLGKKMTDNKSDLQDIINDLNEEKNSFESDLPKGFADLLEILSLYDLKNSIYYYNDKVSYQDEALPETSMYEGRSTILKWFAPFLMAY